MSEAPVESDDPLEQIREAIAEIRNEGLKASLIHGVVESSLVLIALAVGLSLSSPSWLPETVTVPASVIEGLNGAAATAGYSGTPFASPYEMSAALLLAVAAGLVFFVVDVALVYRSRTVETFEAFNPEVREALRTARDAAEDGHDDTMARQLYDEVIEKLEDTSSGGFISGRRMAMSLVMIIGIGLLVVYVSMLGLNFQPGEGLFPGGGGPGGDGAASSTSTSEEKQSRWDDANSVLGEEKSAGPGGTDSVGVGLTQSGSTATGSGTGGGDPGEFPDSSTEVQTQRAGYDAQEQIEDADLVKNYNLRIREEE
jgi:hypothetical protein